MGPGPMGPGPLGPWALAHWAHGPWPIGPMGPGPLGPWALAHWAQALAHVGQCFEYNNIFIYIYSFCLYGGEPYLNGHFHVTGNALSICGFVGLGWDGFKNPHLACPAYQTCSLLRFAGMELGCLRALVGKGHFMCHIILIGLLPCRRPEDFYNKVSRTLL